VAHRDTENEKIIRKLGGVCLTLSTKLKLVEDRGKGYLRALNSEKKKRKRSQPFTEELRAEEGVSVLFFSLSKVIKARELQDAKGAAKEQEALGKVSRAEARASSKAQKELEVRKKREDRAARAKQRRLRRLLRRLKASRPRKLGMPRDNLKQSLLLLMW
jgi:hypothetical protein